MTQRKREQLAALLKSQPRNRREFMEALREADFQTLGMAIKECILRTDGILVNRSRVEFLVDTLVERVTTTPAIELQVPAGKGGK